MYPEKKDLEMIFANGLIAIHTQEWEEGLAIGFCQPQDDLELTHQLDSINKSIDVWIEKVKNHEISLYF
jgi:hypothetical protein